MICASENISLAPANTNPNFSPHSTHENKPNIFHSQTNPKLSRSGCSLGKCSRSCPQTLPKFRALRFTLFLSRALRTCQKSPNFSLTRASRSRAALLLPPLRENVRIFSLARQSKSKAQSSLLSLLFRTTVPNPNLSLTRAARSRKQPHFFLSLALRARENKRHLYSPAMKTTTIFSRLCFAFVKSNSNFSLTCLTRSRKQGQFFSCAHKIFLSLVVFPPRSPAKTNLSFSVACVAKINPIFSHSQY